MSDYHKDGKLGFERNITILTIQVTRLEGQLKYARECNNVKDKYWDKIKVERNVLKKRVEEIETELYFCNRNKRVGEIVDGY
jgi:hypothetical protein